MPYTLVLVSRDCLKSMQQSVRLYESFYLGRLIGQVNSIPKTSNKIKANTNINVVMLDNPNWLFVLFYVVVPRNQAYRYKE